MTGVDCLHIANIARLAGAPTEAGAGIDLLHRPGDAVRKGEPLFRIHGSDPTDLAFAVEANGRDPAFQVTP